MFICRLDIITAFKNLKINLKSGFHASSYRQFSWLVPFSKAVACTCSRRLTGFLKVRLFKASSSRQDLLVVFLLVLVCECSFMSSDEKWRCEVRGFIVYDRNLAGKVI